MVTLSTIYVFHIQLYVKGSYLNGQIFGFKTLNLVAYKSSVTNLSTLLNFGNSNLMKRIQPLIFFQGIALHLKIVTVMDIH